MSHSSRRGFVVGGLVVAAGTSVAGCGGGAGNVVTPAADNTPKGPALVATEVDEWEKLVGTGFMITNGTSKVPAILASLERIADASRPSSLTRRQPFFATFQMDRSLVPTGGQTYELWHATRGSFELFLGMASEMQGKGVLTAVLN